MTETLSSTHLENVVMALFPNSEVHEPPTTTQPLDEDATVNVPPITSDELKIQKFRSKNTAPGPDGHPKRVWVLALDILGDRFWALLNECLVAGRFPCTWKCGKLVLLKKGDRYDDSPSAH